jgi:heme-degrading monooxygenase HmoA
MVICVFGVTYREDADLELEAHLTRKMADAASKTPGFISYKSYRADDGDEVGLIRFVSREALKAWRDNTAHRGGLDEGHPHLPRVLGAELRNVR